MHYNKDTFMKDIKNAFLLDFIIKSMIEDHNKTKSNGYNYNFILRLFHNLKKESNPMAKDYQIDDSKARDLFKLIHEQEFNDNKILNDNFYVSAREFTGDVYYNTIAFMNNGGFEKLYNIENLNQKENDKKRKLEYENLKFQTKLARWKVITFWISVVFSIIALGLSLYNTFGNKK